MVSSGEAPERCACRIAAMVCVIVIALSRCKYLRNFAENRFPLLLASLPLVFPPDGALVPMTQRQMRDPAGEEKDGDAAERDQQQRGKHARDLQAVPGFEDPVGKPRGAAA